LNKSRTEPKRPSTNLDPAEWLARRKAAAPSKLVSRSEGHLGAVSQSSDQAAGGETANQLSDSSKPDSSRGGEAASSQQRGAVTLDLSNRPTGSARSTANVMWDVEPDNPEAGRLLSRQLAEISEGGENYQSPTHEENFALVRSIAPQGAIQSMMAVHLVSMHTAIVKMSGLVGSAEGARLDRLIDAISKLSRAHSAGVDALMRHQARAPKQSGGFAVNVILARSGGVCKAADCQWVAGKDEYGSPS
jgi:hypothetical protein